MKLLFLTEFFPQNDHLVYTGGVEIRTYQIAKRAKKDFKVQVISRPRRFVSATWISIFPRIYYLFSTFFKALFSDFDLIESSNFVTYLPAFLAGFIKRKKTVAWVPDVLGGDWLQLGFFVGLFGYLVEKISLKLPWDQIIALSQSTKQKLIKHGLSKEKITVVKAGIDPKEFTSQPKQKFNKFTIICVARLVSTKRIKDLILAFSHLNEGQLIIVGQGPQRKSLIRLADSLNISKSVTFYHSLSRFKLLRLLNKSHLFCLPSIVEGFGIVTIESYASGLPAVLADIPINHEVTKDHGCLFFKPKDEKDLASKLKILMTNSNLYQQKSSQAKKLAKKYTWPNIYQQTKQVYEDCFN